MIPTAWELLLAETRAGLRRYAGTDIGEAYQSAGAHFGTGDFSDPNPIQRTLGDYVDPTRPGSVRWVVNAVSREVGADAKDWDVARLVEMVGQIARERRARTE